jgi:hypothetical protein
VKAKLKSYHSPDVFNLEEYHPPQPNEFGFLLQLLVGPDDGKGEESFNVMVVSPKWLEANHKHDQLIIGRHYLIVFEYNFDRIIGFLRNFVENCDGSNWEEVAEKVARIGHWEFEDYQTHLPT